MTELVDRVRHRLVGAPAAVALDDVIRAEAAGIVDDAVLAALDESAFAGGLWQRLTGNWRHSATQAAIDAFSRAGVAEAEEPAIRRVEGLLQRRRAQLERMRRHLRLKALLEVWLYVHVPATFALIAALTAHVISVFYYW